MVVPGKIKHGTFFTMSRLVQDVIVTEDLLGRKKLPQNKMFRNSFLHQYYLSAMKQSKERGRVESRTSRDTPIKGSSIGDTV